MAKTLPNIPNYIVEKQLPSMFKSYEDIGHGNPSSWIVWANSDKPLFHTGVAEICHASMKYYNPGLDHLITAVPKSDELSLAYLRMLSRGPFKAFSDLISLSRLDGNYFIHCSDLAKWPANVLYNYCIATRVPIEWSQFLPYWSELVAEGYDSTLAFLLSYSVGGQRNSPRTFPGTEHFWLDAASSWSSIIQGEMIKTSVSYKKRPIDCTPCNKIWGKSDDYSQLMKMSDKEISEFYKLPIQSEVPVVKPRRRYNIDGVKNPFIEQVNIPPDWFAIQEPP